MPVQRNRFTAASLLAVAVAIVSAVAVVVSVRDEVFADGTHSDSQAPLVEDLRRQLLNEELSAEERSLLQQKLASVEGSAATQSAAPRPPKVGPTLDPGAAAPTVGPFDAFIGTAFNSPYHNGYAVANNEWEGWFDGRPGSVVAGNLNEDRSVGLLTVWLRSNGSHTSVNYEVRVPGVVGSLVIVAFDERSVVAADERGARWRLDLWSRELTAD